MYFSRDGDREIHYLIDRKNEYYYVPELHFPVPNDDSFQAFHTDTIIDGELVLDTIAPGKRVLKYLVFDCLIMDSKSVMERTLDWRLAVRFTITVQLTFCRCRVDMLIQPVFQGKRL
jgi:mRNA guanylyltransferase